MSYPGLSSSDVEDLYSWIHGNLVPVEVDGANWLVGVDINEPEHLRRTRLGLQAVVDRRVLSALWGLPEDLSVPACSIAGADKLSLGGYAGGQLVDRVDGCLVRTYRPACSVRLVAVKARVARQAIRLLSHVPPIFFRLAISDETPTAEMTALAAQRQVGLAVQGTDRRRLLVPPPRPRLGSPSVYRWWIAELTYDQWLYAQRAH